jgi:hypothetical protein
VGILVEVIPLKLAAAKHMEVEMGDFLAAVAAVVGDESISCFVQTQHASNLLGKRRQSSHRLGINILKTLHMLFGDDEDMDGSLGIEIVEGEIVIVFVNGVVGNLPFDNLAENTHTLLLLVFFV